MATSDDLDFADMMAAADVKKRSSSRITPYQSKKRVSPMVLRRSSTSPAIKDARDYLHDPEPDFSYRQAGVQKKALLRLRQAESLSSHKILDLHGLTLDQAQQCLADFINRHQSPESPCLLRVITGKGRHSKEEFSAKLRRFTLSWLRSQPHVQAYQACSNALGGSGAFHILISRRK